MRIMMGVTYVKEVMSPEELLEAYPLPAEHKKLKEARDAEIKKVFTGESDKKAAFKKVIVHPCIIAVYIGLFLLFSQWELPGVLDKTIRGAGGCTTTISMIIIGLILAEVDMRQLFNREVFETMIVRLVVLPVFALIIAKLLGLSELLTGVAVVLTAMPAGSTSAMLAAKYNGDYKFASKCIVCTTIASLLTIPIWCMII